MFRVFSNSWSYENGQGFRGIEGMAARSARMISALSVIPDSSNNEKDNNQRRRSLGLRTQVRELQLKAASVKVNASQFGITQPCYLPCFQCDRNTLHRTSDPSCHGHV